MAKRLLWACGVALLAWPLAVGCSEEAGASMEAELKSPYPRFDENTAGTYVLRQPGGEPARVVIHAVGERVMGDKPYVVMGIELQVPDWEPRTGEGIEVWGELIDDTTVEVAGGQFVRPEASTLPLPDFVSVTSDAPLRIDLEPPVGQEQPLEITGTAVLGTPDAAPVAGSLRGSYTRTARDLSVQTPTGQVSEVDEYRVTVELGIDGVLALPIEVVLHAHPRIGLVNLEVVEPFAGFGLGIAGSSGHHEVGRGYYSIHQIETLGQGGATSMSMSSYDVAGGFDADKDTHAKMLMEVRWADDDRARTNERPPLSYDFETVMGYFPSFMVPSPVSFFFPEEAGLGYTYWVAFVDQAAKNLPSNPVSYGFSASYDGEPPVRVASRIIYKKFE